MEGGSYSSSGEYRERNSKVQITTSNEHGTNFTLAKNSTNQVDDQQNYECSESKAGTRKGKYYREIGLYQNSGQEEPETENERLRREYYQKVNEDATIYTIQESLNEFGSTPGTNNSIRRRQQNNGFRLSQNFDSDGKIVQTNAKTR